MASLIFWQLSCLNCMHGTCISLNCDFIKFLFFFRNFETCLN